MNIYPILRKSAIITFAILLPTSLPQAEWIRISDPQGQASITAIATGDSMIYAGTRSGILLSPDNGTHWEQSNSGLSGDLIESLSAAGETVFASGTARGLFVSFNKGSTWAPIDSAYPEKRFRRMITCNTTVLARNDTGATFVSFDKGLSWIETPFGKKVNALVSMGGIFIAATNSHGVYRSDDSCSSWNKIDSSPDFDVMAAGGRILYGGCIEGLYASPDSGKTWNLLTTDDSRQFTLAGTTLIAGKRGNAIRRSADNGTSWFDTILDSGVALSVSTWQTIVAAQGSTVFAAGSRSFFRSEDAGSTWQPLVTSLDNAQPPTSIAGNEDTLFAGTGLYGVFTSTDGGITWKQCNNGLTGSTVRDLAGNTAELFAATCNGLFRTTDCGATWKPLGDAREVRSLCINGAAIYAPDRDSGLLLSTDHGNHWMQSEPVNHLRSIQSIAAYGTLVVLVTENQGMYISSDNGSTWNPVDSFSSYRGVAAGEYGIIASSPIDMQFSPDSGKSWKRSWYQVASGVFSSFVMTGHTTFAGSTGGVLVSKDDCTTWAPVNDGIGKTDSETVSNYVERLTRINNTLYAFAGGVWKRQIGEMTGTTAPHRTIPETPERSPYLTATGKTGGEVTITFTLPSAQHAEVVACTITGKNCTAVVSGIFCEGKHACTWDVRGRAAGCYLVQLRTGSGRSVQKVAVVK